MNFRPFIATLCLAAAAALSLPALAQSDDAAKAAALERYLGVMPIGRMMDDMHAAVAAQLPAANREAFMSTLKAATKPDRLENIMRAAMLRNFSTEELNALADFYS